MSVRWPARRGDNAAAAGTATWGSITGTLSSQTDLQASLDAKLANIVEDVTPQLGANLDLNSFSVTGTGGISITGAITATSYGGIAEANLLDKSATENIAGAWTFPGISVTGGNSTNTGAWRHSGVYFRIYDNATGTNYVSLIHDGTDFNIDGVTTTDINVTGITNFNVPALVATGDVSGATIGGITEANLLDKTAAEDITGDWTFEADTGSTFFNIRKTASGSAADIRWQNESSVLRWTSGMGASTNDDWFIARYTDAGAFASAPLFIDGSTGEVWIRDGVGLKVGDTGDTDYVTQNHDGTDYNIAAVNTTDLNFTGLSNLDLGDANIANVRKVRGTGTYVVFGAEDSGTAHPFVGYNIDSNLATVSHLATGSIAGILFQNTGTMKFYANTSQTAGTTEPVSMSLANGGDLTLASLLGDRIALYNALDATNTYGFGIEGSTLYAKSQSIHRWYINTLADTGTSDYMQLDATNLTLSGHSRGLRVDNAAPRVGLYETDVTTDQKHWEMVASASVFAMRTVNDAYTVADNWLTLTRTGTTPGTLSLLGLSTRFYDSGDTDYVQFSHDGTDFNIAGSATTDINVTGITAFNITGALTASTVAANTYSSSAGLIIDAGSSSISCRIGGVTKGAFTATYLYTDVPYFMKEAATATALVAAYGQWWVKTATPNEPWFMDDAGNYQLLDPGVSQVNTQNASYTLVWADKGKTIHKATSTAAQTYTIPANGAVAWPIGTMVAFKNSGTVSMSIAITTDTLTGTDGATGTRTLTAYHSAVIQKMTSTTWEYTASDL